MVGLGWGQHQQLQLLPGRAGGRPTQLQHGPQGQDQPDHQTGEERHTQPYHNPHTKELDKQWRIRYETIIRAKSIKGYNTTAGKVTENKFQLEVERPELLDDWDQRLVVSTLSRDLTGTRLTLLQTADKDQVR